VRFGSSVLTSAIGLLSVASAASGIGCGMLTGLDDLAIDECVTGGCDGAVGPADAGRADAREEASAADGAVPPGPDGEAGLSDARGDVGGDAPPVSCGGTAGPSFVHVGAFCIDSTEVTNRQYADFLAAKGQDLSALPPSCSFKSSLTPGASWPVNTTKMTDPVVNVDWCDAYAYCAFAGKRLCGAIGGGPSALASLADKSVDQWYAACSASGASAFPYGSKYTLGKCNDLEGKSGGTRPVASYPGCEGATPGVFDMAGNAFEWEDACAVSVGPSDSCTLRGGSWQFSGAQYGICAAYFSDYVVKRADFFNDTGFRCCSK
jgi:sulfatase modifying factor 1